MKPATPHPGDGPTRRDLLARASAGFGLTALRGLLPHDDPAAPQRPHFTPRARAVILCYMSGGVSHVDSFDPKPLLARRAGEPMPVKVERTQFNNNGTIRPSYWPFRPRGHSGLEVSELFPHVGSCADDLAILRGMTASFSEHAQGNLFAHTGFPFLGHPSAGAWTTYGLGSASQDLPGYVVLQSGSAGIPHGGVAQFGNGFLPSIHQASLLTADADEAVRNVAPREPRARQRARLDLLGDLNRGFLAATSGDDAVESAVRNMETAWRMQSAVPELTDLRGESAATQRLYGLDHQDPRTAAYARQCLLARRLVERGVRFVELSTLAANLGGGNGANPWDHHSDLEKGHGLMARQVDQPIAGLLKDLKSRGLLDETLVIWAGEFGRTPFSQGSNGRDHNPYGFSIWLAGGGVQGGVVHGATDEFGYHAVDGIATFYDLWATVLHLLGLDHERLTYRFGGRDHRLTDVHGHVLTPILA